MTALTFFEFFAGGGLARLGLERGGPWRCVFANDHDPMKAAAYRAHFPHDVLTVADVWDIRADALRTHGRARADLAWASFPCQDLSLAGPRAGLEGARSSAFHGFWRLMAALRETDEAPRAIVLENVTGLLTSHGGADFERVIAAVVEAGYIVGAVQLDAADVLPQSRPRVFIVAIDRGELARLDAAPFMAQRPNPNRWGCASGVILAHGRLPPHLQAAWAWWRLPTPPIRNTRLADLLDNDAPWWPAAKTQALIDLMGPRSLGKLDAARASGRREIAAVYRRVRMENGRRVQRAEARFDGLAGCLRTPGGGSSRQFIVECHGDAPVRARAITPREAARLMGVDDDYALPTADTAALKLLGDGVAAPVVARLTEHLLTPLLAAPLARAASPPARATAR